MQITSCIHDAKGLTLKHALHQLSHISLLNNSTVIDTSFIYWDSSLVETGPALVLFSKEKVMTLWRTKVKGPMNFGGFNLRSAIPLPHIEPLASRCWNYKASLWKWISHECGALWKWLSHECGSPYQMIHTRMENHPQRSQSAPCSMWRRNEKLSLH